MTGVPNSPPPRNLFAISHCERGITKYYASLKKRILLIFRSFQTILPEMFSRVRPIVVVDYLFVIVCFFFFFLAVPRRTGLPRGTVFRVQRPAVRRRDGGVAPVLRRGEPVHADVRRLQGPRGGDVAPGAGRHQVPAGLVGHVHRRRVSGERRFGNHYKKTRE